MNTSYGAYDIGSDPMGPNHFEKRRPEIGQPVQAGIKEGQMIQPSVLYHVSFEHSPTGNMLHFPPNDTIPTQLNNQLHHYYNTIQLRMNYYTRIHTVRCT